MFVARAAALLGDIGGFYRMKIHKKMKGTVITMASTFKKEIMSSMELALLKIRPGKEAPKVIEIRFAKTAEKIILGTDSCLNQFTAILLGELSIKIFPIAARVDPNRQNIGSS